MERRPLLIVSRCFGPDRCRWNGETISFPHLDDIFAAADVRFICPEMEIGLGVPRDSIRIRCDAGKHLLVQPATGRDLTADMKRFCDEFLRTLDPAQVDGFILKSRSPSCALTDAKVYDDGGDSTIGTGPGLFGAAVLHRFPRHAVIDEEQLADPEKRRDFMARIEYKK